MKFAIPIAELEVKSNENRPAAEPLPSLWQGLKEGDSALLRSVLEADWFLVLAVAVFLTVLFTNCEHFQVNNGLGHDGLLYAELARDFPQKVFIEKTNNYMVQRLAIPAMLYYSSKAFGFELSDKTILRIWKGLDLFCLTLLAYLWSLTAQELKIALGGKWLGVVFLLVNFAVLKWTSFYPNLTDIPAYTLGAWMFYAYLKRNLLVLAGVTALAAFTWPTAIYIGILLLLFPREKERQHAVSRVPLHLHTVMAGFAGLGTYIFLQHLHHRGGSYGSLETRADGAFVNLGIIISAIYMIVGLFYLLQDRSLFSISKYAARVKTPSCWLASALAAAIIISQRILGPKSFAYSPRFILDCMVWSSVIHPGVFLVTHVAFYGPVVLFAILLWKRVCQRVHECGTGITLCLCALVPLALCSESRRLFNMIPLLVPFVVKAIEEVQWQVKHYLFVTVVSLLGSKVWLTINPDWMENLLRLNVGPWMSHSSYGVHAAVTIALGYIFATLFKPTGQHGLHLKLQDQSVEVRQGSISEPNTTEGKLAA